MNKQIIKFILVLFIFIPCLVVNAQLKSQMNIGTSVEREIQVPGMGHTSLDLNLFDPARFSMNHSYSLSMSSFGNSNSSIGMYINNMSYVFSDKLLLNARVGFAHDPLQMGNPGQNMNMNMMDNLVYGADLTFRPKENVVFHLSFDKRPYSLYNNYGYGMGYRNNYGISPYGYRYILNR